MLASKFIRHSPHGLARPLHTCDWITGCGVLQQLVQRLQEARIFFSDHERPPPGTRTRSWFLTPSPRWTSTRPRLMVFRLSPVISITRCTPPCPHCIASTPANRLRFFSLRFAITRLMARCSFANALRGCCWQSRQLHLCMARLYLLLMTAHLANGLHLMQPSAGELTSKSSSYCLSMP